MLALLVGEVRNKCQLDVHLFIYSFTFSVTDPEILLDAGLEVTYIGQLVLSSSPYGSATASSVSKQVIYDLLS